MPLYGETISVIRKRLRNWLVYSASGSELDYLDLDLLNRARQWLENVKWKWDPLAVIVPLTMATDRTAICPSDMKTPHEVFVDPVVTNKPNIWFSEDHSDVAFRYTKFYTPFSTTDNGATVTGGYWTIQFPSVSPLLSNPKLRYTKFLPDYVGYDDQGAEIVEYSFFPGNLLLRTAQKIFAEEKGITGDNVKPILDGFKEELQNYITSNQFSNQVADFTPKNRFGQPIQISGYALDGSTARYGHSALTPAQQAGLHGY
jgi:hypothetical protein